MEEGEKPEAGWEEKLRQDLTTKQYLAIFTSKMSRGPEHTKVYGHEETNIYCEVSNANIYRLTQMERKKWRGGTGGDGGLLPPFGGLSMRIAWNLCPARRP